MLKKERVGMVGENTLSGVQQDAVPFVSHQATDLGHHSRVGIGRNAKILSHLLRGSLDPWPIDAIRNVHEASPRPPSRSLEG